MEVVKGETKMYGRGQIVIPKPIRDSLDLKKGDTFNITLNSNGKIILRTSYSCVFCGSSEDITEVDGRPVCNKCIKKIAKFEQSQEICSLAG